MIVPVSGYLANEKVRKRMIAGFGVSGLPTALIEALIDKISRVLTIISTTAAWCGRDWPNYLPPVT